MTVEGRGHLLRAFTEAFPNVYTFQQLMGPTLLLVGTEEPLRLDLDSINARLASEAIIGDARAMGVTSAERLLAFFLLDDASTRALAAPYEPSRDDRTIVDFEAPRHLGAGFGFSRFNYPVASEGETPAQVGLERRFEYAGWGDSAAALVPDPDQAARVDRAIRARQRQSRGGR
jgi:hypothetical protein